MLYLIPYLATALRIDGGRNRASRDGRIGNLSPKSVRQSDVGILSSRSNSHVRIDSQAGRSEERYSGGYRLADVRAEGWPDARKRYG